MTYSYQGEPVEPDVTVTLNGETIASLQSLSTTASATLVDLDTEKGDKAIFDITYFDTRATVRLHNSFGSYSVGYWANKFSLNFFMRDEEGNFVKYLGTMTVAFYLFPPFEGFALEAAPGNIAPGEESRLSMESIELPDEPVIIPDNTSVDMRLSPNGKRLGGYAIPFLGVEGVDAIIDFPYGFLSSVPLYYRAYSDSTLLIGTSEVIQLGVFSHFNTSIAGQTGVEVSVEEEDDYKLFISTELNSIYPQNTGGVESTQIEVQVLKENEPVAGFPVELRVEAVPNSGGHDHHDEDRPTGTLTPAAGETNELGTFKTTFTSSEIGGEEWIIASSSETSSEDSLKVAIRVSGLIELEDSPFYEKIGALDNHIGTNDPCRTAESLTSRHNSNHWGITELNRAIKNISMGFNTLYPDILLRINDISLPYGGLFDINNEWSAAIGHNEHRAGINADIGFTGINSDGGCVQLNTIDLRAKIENNTSGPLLIHGNHFHIRLK